MDGNQAYNLKYEVRINNLLKSYPQLKGYRNYLTDCAISTIYQYLTYISSFLQYVNKPPENLIFDDFLSYLQYIQTNQNGEQSTASFRIAVYSALKKYNQYLVIANILPYNYMENIKKPKFSETQKTIEKRASGFLDEKEIKIYVNNVRNGITNNKFNLQENSYYKARDIAIIMLFLNTGIRCSALIKLDVDNVNLEDSEIIVIDKGSKINRHMISEETKDCRRERHHHRRRPDGLRNCLRAVPAGQEAYHRGNAG